MRRLIVSLIAALVLVVPATVASAAQPLPVGTSACPSGKGVVIWHYDPRSGYTYVSACL